MSSEQKIPISMSWSGGKDGAFALWHLLRNPRFEVKRLHTTFGESTRRVGMHGISEGLIEMQAASLGLPLDKIYYPASGDNRAYDKAINLYLDQLELDGIRHLGYGDIFLEDLRKYRDNNLASRGFTAVFPLWKMPTEKLARSFIQAGFKTTICAADADMIARDWVGRDFDLDFLKNLGENIDHCGENGEFHSYCYDGPIFNAPISIHVAQVLSQSYDISLANGEKGKKHFWFAELVSSKS